VFQAFSIIVALAALFSYINHRFLKLPSTIGLMILALISGIGLLALENVAGDFYNFICQLIIDVDFKTILLDVMLSFLLFAGAIHVNIRELNKERGSVILFSTLGVLISTFIVGGLMYLLSQFLGFPLTFIQSLLFGALISPTDPIAVLSILQSANISKSLELKIEGESLFNDGVGVVVFLSILNLAMAGEGMIEWGEIGKLFLVEVLGGLMYGLALGWIGLQFLRSVDDDPKICVLITLAIVTGGYATASLLHVSGPLAMVVAGLYIGNGVSLGKFDTASRGSLYLFWDLLDDTLNAVLFVLIGLVIHTVSFSWAFLLLGLIAIVVVLVARYISVGIPYSLLRHKGMKTTHTLAMLTWGGLRGGISVALALSITNIENSDLIVVITYTVVVFSIIIQGLTIGPLVKKLIG
jgi:CPA1 family monovalent cation:H+ antiporter